MTDEGLVWGSARWRELCGLADAVGLHLCGVPVNVRPGAPRARKAWAEMVPVSNVGGRGPGALVTVRPDMTADQFLRLTLHELAHVRCGHYKLTGFDLGALPADSVTVNSDPAEEAEAEGQVDKWLRWARANVDRVSPSSDPVVDALRVLLTCKVYRAEEV